MRLSRGGQIDRSKGLTFRFNGESYPGHPGDTLASALLANDVRLVGRSFKYHRPRGIFSAGSEEPNALVTLHEAGDQTPNCRATQIELHDGLTASPQNYVGALGFDLMAVNDLFAPFLGAGFYYKTFMWPKSFWERLYEPIIRRAAGLGALSGRRDGDAHEKAWAHCDLLVVGGGPAGLMAARTAGRSGASVILADEDFRLGGRLNGETYLVDDVAGADWAAQTVAELSAMPNIRLMPRTTITGAYDGGTYGAWERVSAHTADRGAAPLTAFWRIVAKRVVLATGATERPIAFAGNDRPGVMLAGAVRTYVNRFGVAPGRRVVVFTNNDGGWRCLRDLEAAGVTVGAVVDPRPDHGQRANCAVFEGVVTGTRGRLGLSGVRVRTADGQTRWIEADCLAVSGGWNPNVHLSSHRGARPVWDDAALGFVPGPATQTGMEAAGAVAGRYSLAAALRGGFDAACRALDLPKGEDVPHAEDTASRIQALWHVNGRGRAFVDFQNDVSVKDITLAHRENFRSVEHMKRYTTLGMATDQGRTANVTGLAIMAELTGQSIPETGTTTFRPPYTPVPIAAMGAGAIGEGFQPARLIPSHEASLLRNAPMLETGQWFRPAWFPEPGETHWRASCDREVMMVRERVGVSDVSTLGKIDIQGPDAARLLDLAYANNFASLKEGRVRYGLMLREDGFVMDDGTTARLGDTHYLMTTTTAAAGQVMAHLEFIQQGLMPGADVVMQSVTDQWAQFAIAGPKARELLSGVLDMDLSEAALPFMACRSLEIDGVPARLFRISFSGELGYELAVPSRYGAALFETLLTLAAPLGGGPYGLEALNVLRMEKGFLTHAEIDGRLTAADLGYGRMVAKGKTPIGKPMAGRRHLISAERPNLVGLKPSGAVKKLLGGAHLFAVGADTRPENDEGYVRSVCYSPVLGHMIALALLKNGRARIGERVRAVDLLRGFDTECEVVALPFVANEGKG